jgi:hypothetical protein
MNVLVSLIAWVPLVNGLIMVLGPIVFGIATKALIGTINSVEAGKLWFYWHGLGLLIGIASLAVAAYAASIL